MYNLQLFLAVVIIRVRFCKGRKLCREHSDRTICKTTIFVQIARGGIFSWKMEQ